MARDARGIHRVRLALELRAVERAERIIVALKEAEAQGKGAASLDGKMIDAASEKMAKNLIATAAAIKASDAARKAA